MTINQLFYSKPPKENIVKIINIIGIKSFDDDRYFDDKTINLKIEIIKSELEDCLAEYYLPCKSKIYFNDITPKKIITILRQCLKLYNYSINYKEKYISEEKKKRLVYKIDNNNIIYKKINFD